MTANDSISSTDGPRCLQKLHSSRRRRQVGDIFVMRTTGGYLFGRVVSVSARWTTDRSAPDVNLVYVYNTFAEAPEPIPLEALNIDRLLFSPIMTNNLGWSRGYFETIANAVLASGDRLPVHCFADSYGTMYDELGNRLSSPVAPVGTYGLASYLSIDSRVCEAMKER